jgi:hypothetical protein
MRYLALRAAVFVKMVDFSVYKDKTVELTIAEDWRRVSR